MGEFSNGKAAGTYISTGLALCVWQRVDRNVRAIQGSLAAHLTMFSVIEGACSLSIFPLSKGAAITDIPNVQRWRWRGYWPCEV